MRFMFDTTVQEKNITYPTDSKLAIRIINRLNKIAKAHGVSQRRTFVKEVKSLRLDIRHFRHVKKRAKAKCALKRLRTTARQAVCDRGYRGKSEVNGTKIILPGKALKRDTRYHKDKKRKQCRRRAAIEPIIGHLKSDYRMARNYLKGAVGDRINPLMAACAWNLKQWLLAIFWLFFPSENMAKIRIAS